MPGRPRDPNLIGWILLAVAIAAAAALVLRLEHGLTYGWDEYTWLEYAALGSPAQYVHPYGGHLIALPYLIYRAVLDVFGADFTAFAIVQTIGLSATGALVYVYAKRRVGPLLALCPALIMLFLGSSWVVLLEPMIGIQFLASIVPGLAAIVLLERHGRGRDAAACLLLILSLAAFSQGVIFLVGAAVSIAIGPRRRRRLWVVALPALLYGGWRLWAARFGPTGILGGNLLPLPSYFVDALVVFASAVFGFVPLIRNGPWTLIRIEGFSWDFLAQGIGFAALEGVAVCAAVWALRARGRVARTLWPALAMLVALILELGVILVPGRTAAEPRYLYAGVLLLLLVVVEVLNGARATRPAVLVAALLAGAAIAGNLARLDEGWKSLDQIQHEARADMAVIELAGKDGDQSFTPNIDAYGFAPTALVLNSGPWLEVVDRYGSPAYSPAELRRQAGPVRREADAVAIKLLRIGLEPSPARAPERVAPAAARRCSSVGRAAGPGRELVLPPGGAVLSSERPTGIAIGRWAKANHALATLAAGEPALLRIPADRATGTPWRLAAADGGPLRVCPIPPD